jgi:hypothetical protein
MQAYAQAAKNKLDGIQAKYSVLWLNFTLLIANVTSSTNRAVADARIHNAMSHMNYAPSIFLIFLTQLFKNL